MCRLSSNLWASTSCSPTSLSHKTLKFIVTTVKISHLTSVCEWVSETLQLAPLKPRTSQVNVLRPLTAALIVLSGISLQSYVVIRKSVFLYNTVNRIWEEWRFKWYTNFRYANYKRRKLTMGPWGIRVTAPRIIQPWLHCSFAPSYWERTPHKREHHVFLKASRPAQFMRNGLMFCWLFV